MTKHTVLHAKRYSFSSEGKNLSGTKVVYLADYDEDAPDSKGRPVLEVTGDYTLFPLFTKLPSEYELEFQMTAGRNHVPKLALSKVQLSVPAKT
jgi:hypothetical protein